jgi:hypothetical protein
MNTSPTSEAGSNPASIRFGALIAQLQTFRSSGLRAYWRVYLVLLCYGGIAWIQGEKFLMLYLGITVVVFMLHEMSVRRVERQIDSVLDTLRELQKDTKD